MNDARDLFLRICGIDVADVAVPHRLLRLNADERNPHAVNQAAARVLTQLRAATGQIPSPHLDWMTHQVTNARNFLVMQCGEVQASPQSWRPPPLAPPPIPQKWQSSQPPAAEPPVVVRTAVTRRRSGFDAENVMGIVGILVMLAAAGIGAKLFHDNWWASLFPPPTPRLKPSFKTEPIPSDPLVVDNGGGEPSPPQPAPDPEPQPRPAPKPKGDLAAAFVHLNSAFANLRKGFFGEADQDAQKALMAAPDCDEAQAMRLAVAYAGQFTKLADEALDALNENDVVDLGPTFGRAAFISRDDDGSIRFQVKGRPKSFTPAELARISGVRFRVAESFLDNANNPANDLILGAYHLVSKLNGDGNLDSKGAVDAARERWRKVASSGDERSREHAGRLLFLLDKLPELEQTK